MADITHMAARSGKVIRSDNTIVNEADGINDDGSLNVKLTGSILADSQAIPTRNKPIETKSMSNFTVLAGSTLILNNLSFSDPNVDEILFAVEADASASYKFSMRAVQKSLAGAQRVYTELRADISGSSTGMINRSKIQMPKIDFRITNNDATDQTFLTAIVQIWYR